MGGLVSQTEKGLFCEEGGFYIDPHRAVDLAVITHAHSDHARRGSKQYITVKSGVGLLKARLGQKIDVRSVRYGEKFKLGQVWVSLHSAGHILGSSQVRIESGGEVWLASGDYKRDPDPSCDPFEVVKCDTMITEATFGTPKYAWDKSATHGQDIFTWWKKNASEGKNTVVFGYSLGKGQRILAELASFTDRPVLIHDAMSALTQCYRDEGRILAPTRLLADVARAARLNGDTLKGEIIVAPQAALDEWEVELGQFATAFASGWMQGGLGSSFGQRYDHGFVISDHADWNDLHLTIKECGASRVFVQHRNGVLVRSLRQLGIEAYSADELEHSRYLKLPERNLELFG